MKMCLAEKFVSWMEKNGYSIRSCNCGAASQGHAPDCQMALDEAEAWNDYIKRDKSED